MSETPDGEEDDPERVARAELILRLRSQNAAGPAVLAAIERTPRSLFLDAAHRRLAYLDRPAPIECGQTISQPTIVAMMTEALDLERHHNVLEIGTGSGYQAAVLAQLCDHVHSVERHPFLAKIAAERFAAMKLPVKVRVGDGNEGWPEHAPFDRIIVTAAADAVPEALVEQLAEGGVLVAPIGPQLGPQALLRCTRNASGTLVGEEICAVNFVPLRQGVARR